MLSFAFFSRCPIWSGGPDWTPGMGISRLFALSDMIGDSETVKLKRNMKCFESFSSMMRPALRLVEYLKVSEMEIPNYFSNLTT